MEPIHEESFKIRSWDVDRENRLTMAAAFNFFQEIAGNHAESLGVGRDALSVDGRAWILSRMSASLDRRPRWGETIRVHTWPRGVDRLFAIRDYEIIDEAGLTAARGRSAWLVVDVAKLRPLRPGPLVEHIPLNEGRDALLDGVAGLVARDGLEDAGVRKAAYSDLDYNGHVNNARYVQWIQDVLPARDLETADRLRLDINYLSEVKPENVVSLATARIDDDDGRFLFAVEGRLPDSQTAFRSELRGSASGAPLSR